MTIINPTVRTPSAFVRSLPTPTGFGARVGEVHADLIPLYGGSPASETLPRALFAELAAEELAASASSLQYSTAPGDPALREWIADREGVSPGRIVITNGGLHALALAIQAIADPGDVVVVEDPVYPIALRTFQLAGVALHAIPAGRTGLDVDVLERDLASGLRPAVVYLVADFHNPTGGVLPGEARRRLVQLATRYGFVVLWDNPYRDSRFAGDSVEDIDASGDYVVKAYTFAKTLGPGLRLGYLVLPQWLVQSVLNIRSRTDQHASSLTQALVRRFVQREGAFDAVVEDIRTIHGERSRILVDALGARLDGVLEPRPIEGGFFVWADIVDPAITSDALRNESLRLGTGYTIAPEFSSSGTVSDDGIRLGFTDATPERIELAVERLAAAVVAVRDAGAKEVAR